MSPKYGALSLELVGMTKAPDSNETYADLEMIITCAHDSFTRYIRVRSSRQPYKFRLVKVIDPYKRQFFFPIADCSTFFVGLCQKFTLHSGAFPSSETNAVSRNSSK